MMTDEAANPTSSSSLSSTTVANNPFDEQIDKLENSLKVTYLSDLTIKI